MRGVSISVCGVLLVLSCACGGGEIPPPKSPGWTLVIHGGAGVISKDDHAESRVEYGESLRRGLEAGTKILAAGGSSLDAVEAVIVVMEDDPLFNAGRGAVFNWEGGHELDASIMNGVDRGCGAVAGVRTVKHPIRLARLVMERSRSSLSTGGRI